MVDFWQNLPGERQGIYSKTKETKAALTERAIQSVKLYRYIENSSEKPVTNCSNLCLQ